MGLPTAEAMQRAMMAEIEECLKAIIGTMMPKDLLMTWVPAEFKIFDQTLKTFWASMISGKPEKEGRFLDARCWVLFGWRTLYNVYVGRVGPPILES